MEAESDAEELVTPDQHEALWRALRRDATLVSEGEMAMSDLVKRLRDESDLLESLEGRTLENVGLIDAARQAADALERMRWRTGEPPGDGRYIIRYRQGRVERTFIGDWDAHEKRWTNSLPDIEVLAWIPEPEPPEQE